MTSLTDVWVTVKPDMDKFGPEVKRKLASIDSKAEGSKVAGRFGVGFNGAFGGIVKHSAGLFVAGFAAIKGAEVFGSFIKDAQESAKISRITANAVRATGGAAHISADEVGELATAISNKTAIDDEQVQSAANMLLTFKNIRNEAGKNNDIFNRATQAAADLSVQFGGIDGASKQLGKALNDPIKGISSLSKAGVTFTDQQKKQIKTLVTSGDTLKAQKIILKEIEGQVGGAAAAAADPLERLKVVGGNLAEEIGGFLLPTVSRFATFISDKGIPAVSALFQLFKTGDFTKEFAQAFNVEEDSGFVNFLLTARDTAITVFGEIKGSVLAFAASWKANDGDVTSSGLPGFMERVAYAAHQAFDFFRAEVIPRLQEFAGFVTGTVVPAVAGLASNLVSSFGPTVKDVFGFFKTEVLPRLKDFAGFLGESVIPKVVELATSLSKNKDFLVPFAATILAIVTALKLWAIAQGILNVVMSANPIGLIVVAIAALVGGLVWAYKNSETFRLAVDVLWTTLKIGAQAMWIVLKPILDLFWGALKFGWEQLQNFGKIAVLIWNSIKEPARAAFAFVVMKFLDLVGALIHGAAQAFGWVPGLGDKLKGADKAFQSFKTSVNKSLNGIDDQTITVTAKLNSANIGNKNATDRRLANAYAYGGSVTGGTPGKDSVPGLLMPGEHVLTSGDVKAMGGQQAVYSFRGQLHKFANGGATDVNVKANTANPAKFASEVAAHAVTLVRPAAQKLADQMLGPGGPPGSAQSFRGVKLNTRTIGMLLRAEQILGRIFHITQGSFSTRVAASGSTHAGGGVMDTDGPGGWSRAVSALRQAGFAAWHRTPSQGPWNDHIHSVALGDTSASASAKAQMAAYRRGGDGLGHGMASGGAITKRMVRDLGIDTFDTGGRWKSGTLGANLSGKTETVIPGEGAIELGPKTIEALARAIAERPVLLDGTRVDQAVTRTALRRY